MQPVLLNKLRFLLWKHVEVSHGVGILREPELRGFVCALFDNGGNGLHGSRRELSRWWLPISGGYDVRVVLVLCNSIADIPLSKRDWDRVPTDEDAAAGSAVASFLEVLKSRPNIFVDAW